MGDWRSALAWAGFVSVVALVAVVVVELVTRRRADRFSGVLSAPDARRGSFPSDELAARRERSQRRTGGV